MAFSIYGVLAVLLEAIRPFLVILTILLCIEAAFIAATYVKSKKASLDWRGSMPIAAGFACLGFFIAILSAPWITGASHAQLTGWLDYTALIAASVATGVFLFVTALPVILCLRRAPQRVIL